jgi:hypothetical protein
MAYRWERNPWTGHDLARVSDTRRLVRQSFAQAAPLYKAEEWGDYSLRYPVRGPWMGSPQAALDGLDRELARTAETPVDSVAD